MKTTEDDYYFLPDGRLVFTEAYHRKRGYCCGSGCKHCPFDYEGVNEPLRTILLKARAHETKDR